MSTPPRTTAIGALAFYVSHANPAHYEPSNITFGIMEPVVPQPRSRADRKRVQAERALADLDRWIAETGLETRRETAPATMAAAGGA
jgi:methylenetetrahydrofolate--tRNA-(uracil-5-)-methyltransferase